MPPQTELVDLRRAGINEIIPSVTEKLCWKDCLEDGWEPVGYKHDSSSDFTFCCLTRHIPKKVPPASPIGLERATPEQLRDWKLDQWAQAPYQYARSNKVRNRRTRFERRLLTIEEERFATFLPA